MDDITNRFEATRRLADPGMDDMPTHAQPQTSTLNTLQSPGDVATMAAPVQGDTMTADSTADNQIMLRGKPFQIKSCLSDNSGEAQVYLGTYEGQERVLKVYYPNFTVNKNLMKLVANMNFEMIVKLFDYGKTYVDGKLRDYELMEYLQGGTMVGYRVDGNMKLFRRLALQAAAALAYCHNNRLIHKDIKPGNIFFRDKEKTQVAIADFGISAIMSPDESVIRTTQARTPLYAAPEMYTDVIDGEVEISPAVDYYSLGMTLLAIWTGDKPLNSNERDMMKRKNEGRIPGVQDLPERVKMLIQGLTAVKATSRWTYDQVEKWFLGESPDIDLSSPWLKYKAFVVDPERNLVAESIQELVPMLLDNEPIARNYLYSGRITNWLEMSGNTKLSITLKDIIKNRYPLDQEAGLMAAIYAMEPTYPYRDMHGNKCDDMHGLVMSLLNYADEYAVTLRNTNDSLWLYLESHSKCNVNRLRSYFTHNQDGKVAVTRCVYELDDQLPFLPKYPSSSLKEIVKAFGYQQLDEDAWHSLGDGRLLSWMYSREDAIVCESVRYLTENQEYSKTLAYKVLYNLDKTTAYDLREANTPEKVGEMWCELMKNSQHTDEDTFRQSIDDYVNPDGRFHYYAQLHGWSRQLAEIDRSFEMDSNENRDRYGAYDYYTAAYRSCCILGVIPYYQMPCGDLLKDGRQIASKYRSEIRTELNKGIFAQWLTVFYHEDPSQEFAEPYSYERELVKWIEALGDFNAQHPYYHRYHTAKEATKKKYDEMRHVLESTKTKVRIWKSIFVGLSVLWLFLLIRFGISDTDLLFHHSFVSLMLPIGGVSAAVVVVRSFFKGYGTVVIFFQALLAFLSSMIPITILRWTVNNMPGILIPAAVAISLVYIILAIVMDYRQHRNDEIKRVTKVVEDDDKSDLLEPLYYTFKTKSFRFKGSKFSAMDEAQDCVRSVVSESVIYHFLWSLMFAALSAQMIAFHPKLLHLDTPNLDIWEIDATRIYKTPQNSNE